MSSGKWRPFCLGLNELNQISFNNIVVVSILTAGATRPDAYSISQEICTQFCCALLCCGYVIVHNEFKKVFIHIHQGCFAGTGAIGRLPQCQWSKPDGYGKISQCITTTKHSKAKTVCIFLGIYCRTSAGDYHQQNAASDCTTHYTWNDSIIVLPNLTGNLCGHQRAQHFDLRETCSFVAVFVS